MTPLWTKERLHEMIETSFAGWKFIVVSNREPFMHRHKGGGIECVTTAGGLTTALRPILVAGGGTWIAHGAGDADRETADENGCVMVPPENPSYKLRRVWLTPEQERGHYYGLSNEGLWPLCHFTFTRPTFRESDWQHYREVNRIFADAVLDEAGDGPTFVFIQDYHFGLLPRMLKEAGRKQMVVAQFWHIPWPDLESIRIFPWGEELLHGLTGNDLLGFHVRNYCHNFLETADRALECRVDREQWTITRGGHTTAIQAFPISIDFEGQEAVARRITVEKARRHWCEKLNLPADCTLGIGIERMDYTKGIPDRLRALDLFFEQHAGWRGLVTFVQIAAPSRSQIPAYQAIEKETMDLAAALNQRWGTASWQPVHLITAHHDAESMTSLHLASNFMIVNSLHDGMNLVGKEYCASRYDEKGVLILSKFTGAYRELRDALGVNPYSCHETAEAIHAAVVMSADEQARRMRRMRAVIRKNNVYRWAGKILSSLLDIEQAEE